MDRCLGFFRTHTRTLWIGLALVLLALISPRLAATGGSLYVLGSVIPTEDIIRYLIKQNLLDAAGGYKAGAVKAKTADYTIVSATDPSSTLFTTRGAGGAVTFTLPAVAAALAGVYYDFIGVANQNIAVAAAAGTVVTFNNAAATSVTASTGGGKIGAHFRAICDGTSWHVVGDAVGVTYTVA